MGVWNNRHSRRHRLTDATQATDLSGASSHPQAGQQGHLTTGITQLPDSAAPCQGCHPSPLPAPEALEGGRLLRMRLNHPSLSSPSAPAWPAPSGGTPAWRAWNPRPPRRPPPPRGRPSLAASPPHLPGGSTSPSGGQGGKRRPPRRLATEAAVTAAGPVPCPATGRTGSTTTAWGQSSRARWTRSTAWLSSFSSFPRWDSFIPWGATSLLSATVCTGGLPAPWGALPSRQEGSAEELLPQTGWVEGPATAYQLPASQSTSSHPCS